MTDFDSNKLRDPRDLSDVPDEAERLKLLARYIDDRFAEFEKSKYREKVLKAIKEGRQAYEQEFENVTEPWPGACGLRGPVTAIAVDSLEPKMVQSLVSQDEIVRADGQDDDPATALVMEFDNWWWTHELRLKQKVGPAVHDVALDGTIYFMAQWLRQETIERNFVRQMDPNTGEEEGGPFAIAPDGSIPTEDKLTPTYDGGDLTHLTFNEVYIPDDVDDEDWDSCPLIRPVNYTYAKMKSFQEQGILGWQNVDEELKNQVAERQEKDRSAVQESRDVEFSKSDRGVDCLEFHGEFDINGDGRAERIVAVKPKGVQEKIVRLVDLLDLNPKNKKLIRRMTIFRESGVSYGRGLPHLVAGIQRAFDDTIRRIFNAADMQIDPWMLGDIQSVGFKDQKPKILPGAVIDCKNPERARVIQFPGNATQFLPLIEVLLSFLERMISAPDYTSASKDVMGVKGSMATATGTMALLSEGNLKHDYKGKRLQDQFLEVCELLHALYYWNMPMVVKSEMLGKSIFKHQMGLTPKFALVSASSTSNKFIDRQETVEMLETADKVGLAPMLNPAKAAEDLLTTYGKKNIEEWIKPEVGKAIAMALADPSIVQEMEALMQQRQMEQQIAAQAMKEAGGAPPGPEGPQMQPGMAA